METVLQYVTECVENDYMRIVVTKCKNTMEEKENGVKIIKIPSYNNHSIKQPKINVPIEQVTTLILTNCRMKYIPAEFCFPNLKEIDFSSNLLQVIPDWIINSDLKLIKLNLASNSIQQCDSVPKCSTSLRFFDISDNKLSNFPFWVFSPSVHRLESVNLSRNPFAYYPPVLSGRCLVNLSVLKVKNCNFKPITLIQEIPNLKRLHIGNDPKQHFFNNINLPNKSFASADALVELDISGLGLSNVLKQISVLAALEVLNLARNHIFWLPENFSTMFPCLRSLNLSHNELIVLPTDLYNLKNFVALDISHNMIGSLPASLQKVATLKILDCYSNDLTESVINIVDKLLPQLEQVDLEQNAFVVEETNEYIVRRQQLRVASEPRTNGAKIFPESDEFNNSDLDGCEYDSCETDENEPFLNECYNVSNFKEENWDTDDSLMDDSFLVLPPYKIRLIKKPVPYDPSDYIDPVCFEDAPEDST